MMPDICRIIKERRLIVILLHAKALDVFFGCAAAGAEYVSSDSIMVSYTPHRPSRTRSEHDQNKQMNKN